MMNPITTFHTLRTALTAVALWCAAVPVAGCVFDATTVDQVSCSTEADCESGKCVDGICLPVEKPVVVPCGDMVCFSDEACCDTSTGRTCVRIVDDKANCGACASACDAASRCVEGICSCPAGHGDCNADPSDGCESILDTDTHCGECGRACAESQTCAFGACVCDLGLSDCDSSPTNGCEADIKTSISNCGGCNQPCADGQQCVNGTCECEQGRCSSTQACCKLDGVGVCVEAATSTTHCGACGHACRPGESCIDGACKCGGTSGDTCEATESCCGRPTPSCVPNDDSACNCGGAGACPDTEACCNNTCVALDTIQNCGACGVTCGSGATCDQGACTCGAGKSFCGTGCVDLNTSADHCGACDAACGGACCDGQCIDTASDNGNCGGCGQACGLGEQCCNGTCTNVQNNDSNCGACGISCTAGAHVSDAACVGGVCRLTCASNWGDCDGDTSNGCEADLTRKENCGGCGLNCGGATCTSNKQCWCGNTASGERCMPLPSVTVSCGGSGSKECRYQCVADRVDCNNRTSDGCEGCGTCNTQCASDAQCISGSCRCGSATGQVCTQDKGDNCDGTVCQCGSRSACTGGNQCQGGSCQ